MAKVYVKIFSKIDNLCCVPIETLVTLFVVKFCDSKLQIMLVKSTEKHNKEKTFNVDVSAFKCLLVEDVNDVSILSLYCQLPNLEENEKCCIAGLCATLRKIVKITLTKTPEHGCRILLGFKESCLLACSETSVWTKFCEVDIISSIKFLNEYNDCNELPLAFSRFENHMSHPIKLHNVYKNAMSKTKSSIIDKSLVPEHIFAEGSTITLADIIIFVCVHSLFNFIGQQNVADIMPLTFKWYKNIASNIKVIQCLDLLKIETACNNDLNKIYSLPVIKNESLYKSDSKKYKPKSQTFTKQEYVENSLAIMRISNVFTELNEPFCNDSYVNWNNIPFEATPEGGNLPISRLQKKMHQLESLCNPILKIAKPGNIIVDFCSGGGHLGILLAYLLPKCNIILLENKSESMKKAVERVYKLKLSNITFYQCNLDYFKGDFDIGTSLHACGVATDLVIQMCIKKNAAFVSCPCCYGSIQDCHSIVYPRSKCMKNILTKKNYMILSHAADQTHDKENVKTKQGYECMQIIDSDRRKLAEENGYKVYLNKLKPDTCSPKNHLLIGLPGN